MCKALYKRVMSFHTDKQAEGDSGSKCPFLLTAAMSSNITQTGMRWQSQVQALSTDHWCWSSGSTCIQVVRNSLLAGRSWPVTALFVLDALCASLGQGKVPHGLYI